MVLCKNTPHPHLPDYSLLSIIPVQHFLYWRYPQNIILLNFSQHMHTCMCTRVHRYTQKWSCYNPVMNCYLSSVLYPPNFSFQVFQICNIHFLICSFLITQSHLPSSLLALLNQFSQRSLKIMSYSNHMNIFYLGLIKLSIWYSWTLDFCFPRIIFSINIRRLRFSCFIHHRFLIPFPLYCVPKASL